MLSYYTRDPADRTDKCTFYDGKAPKREEVIGKIITVDSTITISGDDAPSSDDKVCAKSPDKKHHYEHSNWSHAVENHGDYDCVFCGKHKCVNYFRPVIDPLTLPSDEDLI